MKNYQSFAGQDLRISSAAMEDVQNAFPEELSLNREASVFFSMDFQALHDCTMQARGQQEWELRNLGGNVKAIDEQYQEFLFLIREADATPEAEWMVVSLTSTAKSERALTDIAALIKEKEKV